MPLWEDDLVGQSLGPFDPVKAPVTCNDRPSAPPAGGRLYFLERARDPVARAGAAAPPCADRSQRVPAHSDVVAERWIVTRSPGP